VATTGSMLKILGYNAVSRINASPHMKKKAPTSKKVKSSSSIGTGWITSDEEEIERRRLRALEQGLTVKPLADKAAEDSIFRDYMVTSPGGGQYRVEYRDRQARINSCDCPDFRISGLGTCKHIERVAVFTARKKAPPFRKRSEIFIDRAGSNGIRILWADGLRANSRVLRRIAPFFDAQNRLLTPTREGFDALTRAIDSNELHDDLRVSRDIGVWLEHSERRRRADTQRAAYQRDVADGKRPRNIVHYPLYDYQREGMLHLAFNERAILADEMGLGKTVQAVAACELLRQLNGVSRVLVLCPVSLKTEWQEQIEKFTDLDHLLIQGPRQDRLRQYRQQAFFYLANYEQLLYDLDDIQRVLAPDIIILDEAQRIKNWQTKTARAVKRLHSRYLFVLTGTPLENRIDEIYSIAQVVEPQLLGPLFRFNREFHVLDEQGKPAGYRNLDELHRRLRPIMLRRRKSEVEDELPERIINHYFVAMHEEQFLRYDEYANSLARLLQVAKKRPLRAEEFKRMQMLLSCMRMLCDTPYILDRECRISPKLDELKNILPDLLEDESNKIIIFSEWTGMLELIQDYLDEQGTGYALHTGSIPQRKRRGEINRFKTEAGCRLFLSSDAGATGLNLQVANIVINMDLPWNPARLEQRIARAWRKQQTRSVSVINLVCESSIEHRILAVLESKAELAQSVVDGSGESELALPSGGKLMVERLERLMGMTPRPDGDGETEAEPPRSGAEQLLNDFQARHPHELDALTQYGEGRDATLFAVVREDADAHAGALRELAAAQGDAPAQIQVIDQATLQTIQRLIDAGILSMNSPARTLLAAPDSGARDSARRQHWLEQAREVFGEAERLLRMAELLHGGGFSTEATAPAAQALDQALRSLLVVAFGDSGEELSVDVINGRLQPRFEFVGDALGPRERLARAGACAAEDLQAISELLSSCDRALMESALRGA